MNETAKSSLTPGTVFRFLLFDRKAILKVAASKSAFWIGLLFVVAAGFAREYDGEYLIAEPWHLILPHAASLIGCGFMVVLIFVLLRRNCEKDSSFREVFRSFLNVYWMTAPMAFAYGIPVERFFDPGGATRANLILLAIVSVWRVLLMIRCVQVLCRMSIWRSIVIVLLFCDILAMLALYFVPGPIFMIMGGVRLSDSEQVIRSVRIWLILLCYGTILIWLFGYIKAIFTKQALSFYRSVEGFQDSNPVAEKSLWLTATASILFWIPFLFFTQPEQQLRWKGEQFIASGEYEAFGKLTNTTSKESFPPHWDPPPRVGYGDQKPYAFEVLSGLFDGDAAPWVIQAYEEKFLAEASSLGWRIYSTDSMRSLSDQQVEKLVGLLEKVSRPEKVARELNQSAGIGDAVLTDRRKELIERLEVIAGQREAVDPDRDSDQSEVQQ